MKWEVNDDPRIGPRTLIITAGDNYRLEYERIPHCDTYCVCHGEVRCSLVREDLPVPGFQIGTGDNELDVVICKVFLKSRVLANRSVFHGCLATDHRVEHTSDFTARKDTEVFGHYPRDRGEVVPKVLPNSFE